MILYLTINNNKPHVPFKEMYQLFDDSERAIKHLKELGYENMFGTSLKVGVKSVYYCGDINLEFLPIEVNSGVSSE